jgi:hypothetical protein
MKKSRFLFVGILFIFVQNAYSSGPDEWSGPKERVLLQNWSVNLNIGFTSYFGDLSQYDLSAINKLRYESKPAYGIKLTKYIRNIFGISGQLIYGGFKSDYRPEHSFETRLLEYSLQAGLDVINLIIPRNTLNYGLEIYVGTGQFIFQTSRFVNFDGQQTPNAISTGVPEFVYFFGGELYFKVSDRIRITADLSIRQAQNDNIDKYLANGDFDYYSLLSFGITYSIGRIFAPNNYESNFKLNKDSPVWRTNLK